MEFFRDSNGVICMAPKKYIEKMIASYEHVFGMKPRQKFNSPLKKGDDPEGTLRVSEW
jgi:hypothetical protein